MANRKPIGVYTFCNTGSVLVYKIDNVNDSVLAGINDYQPEWCKIDSDYEGFHLGEMYIPFNEVVRL